MPAIQDLSRLIAQGLPPEGSFDALSAQIKENVPKLSGERNAQRSVYRPRVVYLDPENNVLFAGLMHADSRESGVYGGMSLVWFQFAPTMAAAPGAVSRGS